ncbi:MAG: DUF4845 domain-containing protein [Acidiferrobacter sp.]
MSWHRERGATLWGLLFCFTVAGFIVFLAFKVAPPYMDNWQIKDVLASVASRPDASAMSGSELRDAVRRGFNVGYVSHVSVSKDLRVQRTLRGRHVLVFSYDVRVPILYNIAALIHFVDRHKVSGP